MFQAESGMCKNVQGKEILSNSKVQFWTEKSNREDEKRKCENKQITQVPGRTLDFGLRAISHLECVNQGSDS